MGLTGSLGVLPFHYTEMLLKRLKLKDKSMQHFFDLFNHRTISLFYQASTKYSLPLQYEKNKLGRRQRQDNHSQALLSLIGLGTAHLNNRLITNDESLIQYSGHLTQQIRTASGLSQILQQHFSVPVKIKEFVGEWIELIDDVRSRLPSKRSSLGQNNCLGKSAMLGCKGWFVQGKISIIVGPLNNDQLERFSPDTSTLSAMNELVQFYLGTEHDYEFKIRIRKSTIPAKVALTASNQPRLGWNTWLSSKPNYSLNTEETIDISVSSGRIQSPKRHQLPSTQTVKRENK
jgi:type VI secretion system protein ImpH